MIRMPLFFQRYDIVLPVNKYKDNIEHQGDHFMPPGSEVQWAGEVLHLARSGRLIVRLNAPSADPIKPGELLIDAAGKRIGRVVELLGPVSMPYASVIPMTDRTSRLIGSKVFRGGFAKMPRNRDKRSRLQSI
jgi:rRNA processing protein Gar1